MVARRALLAVTPMRARDERLGHYIRIQVVDEFGNRFVVDIDAEKLAAVFILEGSERTPFVRHEAPAGVAGARQRQARQAGCTGQGQESTAGGFEALHGRAPALGCLGSGWLDRSIYRILRRIGKIVNS
jgi:hypothetical protein